MKKIIPLIIIACLSTVFLQAQEKSAFTSYQQPKVVLKANLFNVSGVGVEVRIKNNITFVTDIGFNPYLTKSGESSKFRLEAQPMVVPSLRYYYNLNKRMEKDKKIAKYAANYLTFGTAYSFYKGVGTQNGAPNIYSSNYLFIGHGWQRRINKHFYWRAEAQVRYSNNSFNPGVSIGIGYDIGSEKLFKKKYKPLK